MRLDLLTPIRSRLIGFSRALFVGSECRLSGVYHVPVGIQSCLYSRRGGLISRPVPLIRR